MITAAGTRIIPGTHWFAGVGIIPGLLQLHSDIHIVEKSPAGNYVRRGFLYANMSVKHPGFDERWLLSIILAFLNRFHQLVAEFRWQQVGIDSMLKYSKEDAENEAMKSSELISTAQENLKATIEGLLYPILKAQGYSLIWE